MHPVPNPWLAPWPRGILKEKTSNTATGGLQTLTLSHSPQLQVPALARATLPLSLGLRNIRAIALVQTLYSPVSLQSTSIFPTLSNPHNSPDKQAEHKQDSRSSKRQVTCPRPHG